MKAKEIALQVVNAMPEDAGFDDLDEFLYERALVERGRQDFESNRVRSHADVALGSTAPSSNVLWAEQAATEYLAALRDSSSSNPDDASAFVAAVAASVEAAVASPTGGISLREMGDPSILEVPALTPRMRHRVLFDLREGTVRILHFTNNTTCYRNQR